MNSTQIKKLVYSLGADLCGIASLDRFSEAPKGYHPLDVFPECKSVISFACRFPVGVLKCNTSAVYTRIRNSLTPKMDAIALELCIKLEEAGIMAVPIPTNESEWDSNMALRKHFEQKMGMDLYMAVEKDSFRPE